VEHKIEYCNNDNIYLFTYAGIANITGRIEGVLSAVGSKISAGDED
jgi:hypothetical protein